MRSCLVFFKRGKQKKVGFTASKKVGNAVKRNLAKRRMRAVFLEFGDNLQEGTYIFVAKKEILQMEYEKLKRDITYALKKVQAL